MRGAAVVTPEKLAELAHLQHGERFDLLNPSGVARLDALRRELAMAPEVADDKSTLFTDESRRPQLNGIDWNDANHQMACGEVANFFTLLAAKFGEGVARGAMSAFLAK